MVNEMKRKVARLVVERRLMGKGKSGDDWFLVDNN